MLDESVGIIVVDTSVIVIEDESVAVIIDGIVGVIAIWVGPLTGPMTGFIVG